MDSNMIETVQWISTDRSTLETITNSADEFVESFCEKQKSFWPIPLLQSSSLHFTWRWSQVYNQVYSKW